MSSILKVPVFVPRDWVILERALWGKVYKKTPYGNSELSKLWDRDAIGTPEVHQLLATLEFPYHASEVRIFDVDFGYHKDFLLSEQARQSLRLANRYKLNADMVEQEAGMSFTELDLVSPHVSDGSAHGVLVAHLLAGKSPLPGISTRGKISLLSDADPLTDDDNSQYLELPGVINISKNTGTKDVAALAAVGEKTLLVTSAGNTFPEKTRNVILASRALEQDSRAKIIPVGAIDPDGVVGDYSVADRSVVVTAPGERLFSFDGKKEKKFSHTSAATPFVSGVLADVRSILPQLTQYNALQLLERTAIKTVTNTMSEFNGAGVVNHYKMVRVALRLAEDGYDGELMPDNLDAYLDFSQEVADLIDTSKNSTQFFLHLRRAFFLDPNNGDIRIQLASAYRQMGLISQAIFYDMPSEANMYTQIEKKLHKRAEHRKAKLAQLSNIDNSIAVNIVNTTFDLKSMTSLAEDNDAVQQLKKTMRAEKKLVKKLVASERLPILTDIEINEQLAEAGLPAVRDNVKLYLEKLGLSDLQKRKAKAVEQTLSDFFKSNTMDKNSTDKEVAKLTGISIDDIQTYKHNKLLKVAVKVTQDSGFISRTIQQIHNQLLAQEGIFIQQQTITNYLQNHLKSAFKKVIADEDPHDPLYDPEIAARISYKTEIKVTARSVTKLRKQLGIAKATGRKDLEKLKIDIAKAVIDIHRGGHNVNDPNVFSELIRHHIYYRGLRESTVTRIRKEAGIRGRGRWSQWNWPLEAVEKLGEQAKARLEPAIRFIIANEDPQNSYYDTSIIEILNKHDIHVPSFFHRIKIREFFGLPAPSYNTEGHYDEDLALPPEIVEKSLTKKSKNLKKF